MSDGYNGWTNYPTWCVNLWLGNDQESERSSHRTVLHEYKVGLARAAELALSSEPDPAQREANDRAYARSIAADRLKEYVEELLNDERADMGSDLQSWALGQVNWREIATTWLEDDLKDEDEDQEDDENADSFDNDQRQIWEYETNHDNGEDDE